MFKKTLFILAVSSAALLTEAAQASDGTITFTGIISAAACTIDTVAGSADRAGTVDFGTMNSSTFTSGKAGTKSYAVPFTITLKDCAATSAPKIKFDGTAVSATNYTNLFESGLTGLGIRLEDGDSSTTVYSSGTAAENTGLSKLTAATVTSATGNFKAYLQSYADTVSTGSFEQDVTFTIVYQ